MSGAVVPQWKIALQQKLDKKKEDERRKSVEEEKRRLEALPPWKRYGMVPQNVIIISGGTKTVSKLSTDSDTTSGEKTQKEPSISQNSQVVKTTTTNRKESESRTKSPTSIVNVQHQIHANHVISSQKENHLTNHVGEDETNAGKPAPVAGREGVDEEHVSSVLNNPFLKFDGGARRRRVSPSSRSDDKGKEATSSSPITKNETTDFIKVAKKQPDNSIRQRSRSESPRRAAREHNVDLKVVEEDIPQTRPRKNSVSDLRSRYGRAASTEDLKVVSRKGSEADITSPLSPQSPTHSLDRNILFDKEPHKVHITYKPEPSRSLSPTSAPKVSTTTSTVTSEKLPSTQPQTQKSTVVKDSTPSKQSETKSLSFTESKVAPTSQSVKSTKRQAPKAPTTSESSLSTTTKTDVTPTKTITSSSSSSSSNAVKSVSNSEKSNKPSNTFTRTNEASLPDQPKTAILGDGQSSLRRKKGVSKMSASALISLSSNDSNEVQLSEHNARVRAARQEARTSSSKNSLRSARDGESRDTDSIPKGVVSSNAFGSKLKTSENQTSSMTKPKEDTPFVDSIPYPENFRQPKKESTYVDPIPYPENFRKPKSNNEETSETKLVSSVKKPVMDNIPRTNIDEVILSPIEENVPQNLTNGTVEEKAPPKKIKKKGMEWIGYNTPTGKPSALKSASKARKVEEKKLNISFNESNMTETYEYQSETSLLNEYLREERGLNGNPRVGNLPRQEARDEEDDDDEDIDSTPSSQSGIDNVLAHEGLQNYTPKDLQNFSPMSIRQQKPEPPKPKEETAPPPAEEEPDPDDIAITYDDTGDYFSSAGSSSAALLF
ncbi:mucin-5AC-like [Patiria miniata]|uniref:Uncharacterized protein n=1 Tax=Patiria miniata TaxID=46514 RepID=A0A914AIW2_PATMI|nr:mucin-5AC-like [Patiria miniata]